MTLTMHSVSGIPWDPSAERTLISLVDMVPATLRELARRHALPELSMGTSQDYLVAVQEGATIVRVGTSLYRSRAS